MKNLTLKNIAIAAKGKLICPDASLEEREIAGAVIDSRKVEKDYLFIAVKGQRVDGHTFIDSVFEKGALCVISEQELQISRPYILVDSSLQALKDIAAFYRESIDTKIVGITGSVGKTSTKEFIAAVLAQKYNVLKTEGNFNNEIGVPLTLLRIRDEHDVAVVEMGISDFGEMHRLSYMVKPDICVMTNIGLCHLENLGSRDGILKAKSEIFDFASPDCHVILNGDDDKLQTITDVHGNSPVFYGIENNCDIHAENITTHGIYGTSCTICIKNATKIDISFNLPGRHMVYNAMAAIGVGTFFEMTPEKMKEGINQIKSVGGRLNIIETGDYTIIDDCYNANPVSVRSSLDVLDNAETRKVAILGDMFELGKNEKELHHQVGSYFQEKHIDTAILIGTLSENTYNGIKESGSSTELYYYKTLEDGLDYLDIMLKKGDTILVKASHSMHFEKIVKKIQELT